MLKVLSPLAVLASMVAATAFTWHVVAGPSASGGPPAELAGIAERVRAVFGKDEYRLDQLRLLERTRYLVEDKYVEPERLHPDAMFDAALRSAERKVPELLFRRQPAGRLLHVAVGSYSTSIELPDIDDLGTMVEQLRRVAAILDSHLSDEVPRPQVEYALINGILSTLDPHSVLLPPEVSHEMEVENSGRFGGLGITITIRDGWLTVEFPLEDTPAWRAGIQAGDRIVRIEDESTINMDLEEAVSKLRGEVGTAVHISIDRDSFDSPRVFEIVRDEIQVNPVRGELMEGGVGYARIKSFHAGVTAELQALLARLRRENGGQLAGLVLDLRGNPGGYLHQAIGVADTFLSKGTVVVTVEEGERDERRARAAGTEPGYPMVVLVNASSASASEIVAGALKNDGRAVIVGERTFGKGSVQNLYTNPDDSRLKLTVAKYLTPGDRSIQSVGISPDIRLEPSIVQEHEADGDEGDGAAEPFVSLYWRERVDREAELDHHLDREALRVDPPLYTLRFLRPYTQDRERTDRPDISKDREIQFARDLLLAVPGAQRAEMLAAAGPQVQRYQEQEQHRIRDAFAKLGIDWSTGEQPARSDLALQLDLGPDGVVRSGADNAETIQLRVTNRGDRPVHQVLAISESTMEWLDGDEFYFGLLAPGETRAWSQRVEVPDGYRDEVGQVTFHLEDASGAALGDHAELVRTIGRAMPSFAWSLSLDDSQGGDGDGIVEQGEVVDLVIGVRDVGRGAAGEAFAKLKNRAGHDLDLQLGTAELGAMEPGSSATAHMRFEARGAGPDLAAELYVGDNQRYDFGAVMRAGFYDRFSQVDHISIPVGRPFQPAERIPPGIQVSRAPGLLVHDPRAVLSGVVTDDRAVRDVIVYHGKKKVFYQGGGQGVQALPFSVDEALEPGANLFVVLARDDQGLTDIRSVSVWYDETGNATLAAADLPQGG